MRVRVLVALALVLTAVILPATAVRLAAEGGAPSDFHVEAADVAAVQLLLSSRITKAKIVITYKPDFSVTQIRL